MLKRGLAVLLLLGSSTEAFAQGCAMCLANAMSQSAGAMEAMNVGILILLVPPFVMIVAIIAFTFLRRH